MNPENRPNHRIFVEALRRILPEDGLLKAFELSDFDGDY